MSELYPIGKHLRMSPNCRIYNWYTPDIFRVVGYSKNDKGVDTYITNHKFTCINRKSKSYYTSDDILPKYTVSDAECEKLDRKLKLIKLFGSIT